MQIVSEAQTKSKIWKMWPTNQTFKRMLTQIINQRRWFKKISLSHLDAFKKLVFEAVSTSLRNKLPNLSFVKIVYPWYIYRKKTLEQWSPQYLLFWLWPQLLWLLAMMSWTLTLVTDAKWLLPKTSTPSRLSICTRHQQPQNWRQDQYKRTLLPILEQGRNLHHAKYDLLQKWADLQGHPFMDRNLVVPWYDDGGCTDYVVCASKTVWAKAATKQKVATYSVSCEFCLFWFY